MVSTGPVAAALCLLACLINASSAWPQVIDSRSVTYKGLDRAGVEVFLNVPYGHDTGGKNRFKPPRAYVPKAGTLIDATSYGPACPQQLGSWNVPVTVSNVTDFSENCLNLNVVRPKNTKKGDKLPVLVWIHGGSFWTGQNSELTARPDGLILESVENGTPLIHVAMNYRLGAFGFAKSEALRSEGSLNAGLRDQRLAMEWVRDNIKNFGGDPERLTIHGQSSGGLAVGLHIMAYGGSKPVPFQRAICQSQALEPGITANFTMDEMQNLVNHVGCNSSALDSGETVSCLRQLDTETMLNASLAIHQDDISHNIGDTWLPAVDGDFLPEAPSKLVYDGRFADVTTMIGWCDDDLSFFTDVGTSTPQDTRNFVQSYIPAMSQAHVDKVLDLYPSSDFKGSSGLSREFFRAARIFRDIIMTCQPIWLGEHIAKAGNAVYLYDWNQTLLDSIVANLDGQEGLGPFHTSEFAYIFGNLSHYDQPGFGFNPRPRDYALRDRGSRTWATFATTGRPGKPGHNTFQGFEPAFSGDDTFIFVAGGPHEGLSSVDEPCANEALKAQKLKERCGFLNSPEVVEELMF